MSWLFDAAVLAVGAILATVGAIGIVYTIVRAAIDRQRRRRNRPRGGW